MAKVVKLFASLSTAFAALASINALYLIAGFCEEMSVMMNVISFMWMNCSMVVILVAHKQPAQTLFEINNTAQLLLADEFCQNSKD
ncbi:hypothetical protein COOONC_11865, partial [Cooperia oncophora]